FTEESLFLSLRMVFPYNGSDASLADHLPEYFDTPRHALFVVDRVTNPVYDTESERKARPEVGRKVQAVLESHAELFRGGEYGEAVVVASMGAALYQGDPEAALRQAERLPAAAATRGTAEFRWLRASASVLTGRASEAEADLASL